MIFEDQWGKKHRHIAYSSQYYSHPIGILHMFTSFTHYRSKVWNN